jgi:hypothetical protein
MVAGGSRSRPGCTTGFGVAMKRAWHVDYTKTATLLLKQSRESGSRKESGSMTLLTFVVGFEALAKIAR